MQKKVQVVIIQTESKPNEVLLLKTNPKYRDFWQNVTGSVENEEKYIEAAARELYEETGIVADKICELKTQLQFNDRFNRDVIEKCFLAILSKKPSKIILSNEHEGHLWVKIEEVDKNRYGYETSYTVFKEACKYLQDS